MADIKGTMPSDILPDGQDTVEVDGVTIRKGSVAAVLANACVLADPSSTPTEISVALSTIQSLSPALKTLGMHQHVTWKDPRIQCLFETE